MRFFVASSAHGDVSDIQVPLSVSAINQNELYMIVSKVTSKEELYTSEGWRKDSDQTLACNLLLRFLRSDTIGRKP